MHPTADQSVDKSVTICITLEDIYTVFDSKKIGRLMMIIFDPVTLFDIYMSCSNILQKIKKKKKKMNN